MVRLSSLLAWQGLAVILLALAGGAQLQIKIEQGLWSWGLALNLAMVVVFTGLQIVLLSSRPKPGREGPAGPPYAPPHRMILALTLVGVTCLATVAGAALESWMDAPRTERAIFAALGLLGMAAGAGAYVRLLGALPRAAEGAGP